MAAKYAYLNGDLPIAPWREAYEEPEAVAGPDVPMLDEAVKENVRKVSSLRVVLASHRLAKELKTIFP